MNALGYGLIGVGMLALVGGLIGNILFEQYPQTAERYGTRFLRDASLFSVRIFGAFVILVGAVIIVAVKHAAMR